MIKLVHKFNKLFHWEKARPPCVMTEMILFAVLLTALGVFLLSIVADL